MPAYPTSPLWSYPVVRSLTFNTTIHTSDNGTEQRTMMDTGRAAWVLPYPRLSLAQRDTLLATFETAKGAYSQTLSLDFLGNTYSGCYFDADQLQFTESAPGRISTSVKLCQVTRAADTGSLPADFPTLSTGCRLQLPYTHARDFDTVAVKTEGGRYAYSRRASALRTWSAGGAALTDAEATAIYDMFRKAGGRFRSFGFTDPDSGVRVASCRFGSDVLNWTLIAPGHNSITVQIQELA